MPVALWATRVTVALWAKRVALWAKRVTRQFYDFKNSNFDSLRDSLTRLPFDVPASTDVNEHWSNWKDLFLTAVKEHIPIKTVATRNFRPGLMVKFDI